MTGLSFPADCTVYVVKISYTKSLSREKTMSFHENIARQASEVLSQSADHAVDLNNTMRLLAKWRSILIANTLIKAEGICVQQGPLSGMEFLSQSAEGCHVAKLLGCYEQPLQPFIEEAIAKNYDVVLNIGCAEGYYAVGMARRMPQTKFIAYDTDTSAQKACSDLARKNGVESQIEVNGTFNPAVLEQFKGQTVLVFCDVEGAELELLCPDTTPALRDFDLIVESHECLISGVTEKLTARFWESHEVILVPDHGSRNLDHPPDWFQELAHLDQLLAVWEWRSGPTPWLVMNANKR